MVTIRTRFVSLLRPEGVDVLGVGAGALAVDLFLMAQKIFSK